MQKKKRAGKAQLIPYKDVLREALQDPEECRLYLLAHLNEPVKAMYPEMDNSIIMAYALAHVECVNAEILKREEFFEQVSKEFERLQQDPAAWQAYLDECEEWRNG